MGFENTNSVIVVSSIILIVMAIVMILFIIDAKRYIHSKDIKIKLLEEDCQKEIEALKKEIEELKANKADRPETSGGKRDTKIA